MSTALNNQLGPIGIFASTHAWLQNTFWIFDRGCNVKLAHVVSKSTELPVEGAFGSEIAYSMLINLYGEEQDEIHNSVLTVISTTYIQRPP
jgi:hypothetical protein